MGIIQHIAASRLIVILGLGLCSVACGPAGSAVEPRPPARRAVLPIGTNLDGLAYWNPGLAMLDLMKSSSGWLPQTATEYDTGEPVALDRAGWVMRLPGPGSRLRYTSVLLNVIHDNPAAEPGARYVVSYVGQGTLDVVDVGGSTTLSRAPGRMVVRVSDTGSLYLRLSATDPAGRGDYVRDIRVVREADLPLHAAGLTFNPAFLEKVAPFAVLRFMDWMATNVLFDAAGRAIEGDAAIRAAPWLRWADRAVPTDRRWGDGGRGVPVEAMVEIANRTGAEPWFNMPINASDDYVRGFASYVRDHLRPDLAVHVELSNEVWNRMFPQALFAEAKARVRFGPDAKWMRWYGLRGAQVGAIWKSAFGPAGRGRVRMTYNTQFGWKGLEADGLDAPDWRDAAGRPAPTSAGYDDYAITGYYDGTMNDDAAVPVVQGWWTDADGGYGRAIKALTERIDTVNAPFYLYHAEQARKRGLTLVTYESGFGETTPMSQHGDATYTEFLARLQRRPEFHALETQNYRAFQAAGGALYVNFGIIGTPSKWGNWSALETVRQATTPRYQALRDWIGRNPPWSGGAAVAYADARIHRGGTAGETIAGTAHGYDILIGGAGDDRFVPGGGAAVRIDGGGGDDVLQLGGQRAAYRFTEADGGVRVTGPAGDMIVTRVARVRFADSGVVPLSALAPAAKAGGVSP
ncbi:hypothetical protein ACFSGX_17425 [Sphingomonas arantia]|uniref:Calcium-binding protein n=1 Tax=Sphingomonas arantia TaxID=1460676 RepID=A0ABW4U0W6_9SPHN